MAEGKTGKLRLGHDYMSPARTNRSLRRISDEKKTEDLRRTIELQT
jgi:hypothetical protein